MTRPGSLAHAQRGWDLLNRRHGYFVQIPLINSTGIVTLRWPPVVLNALPIAATLVGRQSPAASATQLFTDAFVSQERLPYVRDVTARCGRFR
jgi:hypothetical protein